MEAWLEELDRCIAVERGVRQRNAMLTLRNELMRLKAENLRLAVEVDNCKAVLRELVEFKMMKDTVGKIESYERRQPIAWEAARGAIGWDND